jgi:ergothioneine biosynthesis protein EgtB
MRPAYRAPEPLPTRDAAPLAWIDFDGGIVEIGHGDGGFAYDCEGPRHETLLHPFALASRAVTCGEWIGFIEDGGYRQSPLWLMEGFATAEAEGWEAPAYWWQEDGRWMQMTLRGAQPVDPDAPVSHVSFYEADAFARWTDARLPTEAEWEHAAGPLGDGTFLDRGRLRPAPATETGLAQMWGDVWEWTASAFRPYPGFRAPEGAIGEYNGKFMINQMVLRGGSALTPRDQMRPSYRNFFHPDARWQMTGLRLARDV